MRSNKTETIADIMRQYLRESGLETPLNEHRLIELWHQVVGNGISRYTSNLNIRNNVLYVHVSSSVLREELSYNKKSLVHALNRAIGATVINDIALF